MLTHLCIKMCAPHTALSVFPIQYNWEHSTERKPVSWQGFGHNRIYSSQFTMMKISWVPFHWHLFTHHQIQRKIVLFWTISGTIWCEIFIVKFFTCHSDILVCQKCHNGLGCWFNIKMLSYQQGAHQIFIFYFPDFSMISPWYYRKFPWCVLYLSLKITLPTIHEPCIRR